MARGDLGTMRRTTMGEYKSTSNQLPRLARVQVV